MERAALCTATSERSLPWFGRLREVPSFEGFGAPYQIQVEPMLRDLRSAPIIQARSRLSLTPHQLTDSQNFAISVPSKFSYIDLLRTMAKMIYEIIVEPSDLPEKRPVQAGILPTRSSQFNVTDKQPIRLLCGNRSSQLLSSDVSLWSAFSLGSVQFRHPRVYRALVVRIFSPTNLLIEPVVQPSFPQKEALEAYSLLEVQLDRLHVNVGFRHCFVTVHLSAHLSTNL